MLPQGKDKEGCGEPTTAGFHRTDGAAREAKRLKRRQGEPLSLF